MRFSLRTLLVAGALAPLALTLAWFGAIWLRFAFPSAIVRYGDEVKFVGLGLSLLLVIYGVIPFERQPQRLLKVRRWAMALLVGGEFLAVWHWTWLWIHPLGWVLVWGDMGPPVADHVLVAMAAPAGLFVAGVTSARIWLGLTTVNYLRITAAMTAVLLTLAALIWGAYWLR